MRRDSRDTEPSHRGELLCRFVHGEQLYPPLITGLLLEKYSDQHV